jgi:hypothetical protein
MKSKIKIEVAQKIAAATTTAALASIVPSMLWCPRPKKTSFLRCQIILWVVTGVFISHLECLVVFLSSHLDLHTLGMYELNKS